MSEAIIITPSIGGAVVSALYATREERDDLLALASVVDVVTDRLDADDAVATLRQLDSFAKKIEAQRVKAQEPVLEIQRSIQSLAKDLTDKIKSESSRISRMVGEFEAGEREKAENARRAAQAEAARIAEEARKKAQAEAAKASNDLAAARAVDRVVEQAAVEIAQAKQQAALVAAPKAEGTRLRGTICFEVENIAALFASNPELVELSPNKAAIKSIIKANPNIKLPGVRHWVENKLSV